VHFNKELEGLEEKYVRPKKYVHPLREEYAQRMQKQKALFAQLQIN
jgi:hypothetical protein